jgi:uncharacterized membrane protein
MSWLFYAIMARFFWACCNMFDHYLARAFGKLSVLGVIIAENIIFFPVILLIALLAGVHPTLNMNSLLWLSLGVVANMASWFPYFIALRHDQVQNVVPLYELTPVLVTLLAWVLFRDEPTGTQLLGALLVVGGGFAFSWDFRFGHIRLKTLLLMSAAAFLCALYQLTLRFGTHHESPWDIALFLFLGFYIGSLILFAALPYARQSFLQGVRRSKGKVLAIAFAEGAVAFLANACIIAAFAKAPKASQVAALAGTQPFFVLLISIPLGFWLPRYFTRLEWNREIKIKCLLLLAIAGGIILLKTS